MDKLEHVNWKPLPVSGPNNQFYGFKFDADKAGYAMMVTDLCRIWSCECRNGDDLKKAIRVRNINLASLLYVL